MSDSLANIDANDVLASIRRLVSETYEPSARGPKPAPVPESDRLVLTAAFRVHEGANAVRDAADKPKLDAPLVLAPEDAVTLPQSSDGSASLDEEIDTASDQDISEPDDADADADSVTASRRPEPTTGFPDIDDLVQQVAREELSARGQADDDAPQAEGDEQEWDPKFDDTPDAEAANHAAHLTLEQRIAELETAVGTQTEEWEPDGSEDLATEIPREFPRAFADVGARVLHFRSPERVKKAEVDISDVEAAQEATGVGEEVEQQAVEHAVDQSAEDTQSFRNTVDDDGVKAGAVDNDTADQEPEIAPDMLDDDFALAGYGNDEMFDEEALRDFVASVIREELQGTLGERITRNVRRLVRREVQRAMTLKDFE